MTISRLQSTVTPSPAPARRPASAAGAAQPKAAAGDTLALSTASTQDNAKALALFQQAKDLDAKGYTTPAEKRFHQAIDASTSVDTLLAIRQIADDNQDGAYSYQGAYRSVWGKSLNKADDLGAEAAKAKPTPASPEALRACLAEARKRDGQEMLVTAGELYKKAIAGARSLDDVAAVTQAMKGKDILPDDAYPFDVADDRAEALAKQLPVATPSDKAALAAMAQSVAMFKADLPKAGEVLWRRAMDAATSKEALYAIQKQVETINEAGLTVEFQDQRMAGDTRGRIWREDHPLRVWNPLSWLPNRS